MTTALDGGASLHALCCDLATGQLLIDTEVFKNAVVPPKHDRNSYASPTPILEADRVVVERWPGPALPGSLPVEGRVVGVVDRTEPPDQARTTFEEAAST